MNVKIVFFSGTGCTEYVAKTISNEFLARGHKTISYNLKKQVDSKDDFDLLVICHVVHACNAPEPVMKWVKSHNEVNNIPVAILSVSGGGEVTPNLACRIPLKKLLKKKKYRVIYEKMIVMPSNWIVETKPVLSLKLLQALPYKLSYVVDDILKGNKHFTYPLLGNRLLTFLGKLEQVGAPFFGRNISVLDACNACGTCVRQCPVDNITMQDSKPVFGDKCVLCLNCIYSCPQKALNPKIMKFVIIKTGFNFKELQEMPDDAENIDIANEAKGFLFLGVKRYLLNTSDMLAPMHKKDRNEVIGKVQAK